jgi:hypothetical protein
MRNAARVDKNQPSIVAGLRAAGYSVEIIGLPVDLLVGWGGTGGNTGKSALLEIKLPEKRKDLTEFQKKFIPAWRGPVCVVTSVDEAIEFLESI